MCGMIPGIEVTGLQFGKALTPDLLHRFGERLVKRGVVGVEEALGSKILRD